MMAGDDIRVRINWTPERIDALRVLVAEGTSDGQCARILKVSRSVIAGARFRFRIKSCNAEKHSFRPIPGDFAELAPGFTLKEAAKHYRASRTTVSKWYRQFDLQPKVAQRVYVSRPKPERATKPANFTPSYRAPRRKGSKGDIRKFQIPQRGATIAAAAQLFLQRYGPVIRATTLDRTAANDQWIVMGRRVTEPEMLAIAERKGFAA